MIPKVLRVLALLLVPLTGIPSLSYGQQQRLTADATDTTVYRLWYRNYDSPPVLAVLSLAFEKTPEYGPYQIERSLEMGQGRALMELRSNNPLIHIAAVASSPEREEHLYGVPFPVDGGLLGYRVCVTLRDQVARFRGVQTINDMVDRGLRIGQGSHWPDTDILRANGAHVITHARFEQLFVMLANRRFECFARGISEVIFDLELVVNDDLVIEPELLLAYPMPSYFFVSPGDHDVAHRIELGLQRARADGSFEAFMEQFYKEPLRQLNLENRTLLKLTNPFIADDGSSAFPEHPLPIMDILRRDTPGPRH